MAKWWRDVVQALVKHSHLQERSTLKTMDSTLSVMEVPVCQ